MDCNCNCFGIAAASKRPVKRYNLLVPDIFPKKEPSVDSPVDAATERKFKRLFEYLEKTPARGPKASAHVALELTGNQSQTDIFLKLGVGQLARVSACVPRKSRSVARLYTSDYC